MTRPLLHAALIGMLTLCLSGQTSGTEKAHPMLEMLAQHLGTVPELVEYLQTLNYAAIADYYNAPDPEGFWVWRSRVPPDEYLGPDGIDLHELPGVEESRLRPFLWVTGSLTRVLDARDIRVRDAIALAFRQRSRTNLQILCRRRATRWERLRAEGTGSISAPGVVADETPLTVDDIAAAVQRMQEPQP